jgi:hypothetical protein
MVSVKMIVIRHCFHAPFGIATDSGPNLRSLYSSRVLRGDLYLKVNDDQLDSYSTHSLTYMICLCLRIYSLISGGLRSTIVPRVLQLPGIKVDAFPRYDKDILQIPIQFVIVQADSHGEVSEHDATWSNTVFQIYIPVSNNKVVRNGKTTIFGRKLLFVRIIQPLVQQRTYFHRSG